jgi:uncharacterized protein YkwD
MSASRCKAGFTLVAALFVAGGGANYRASPASSAHVNSNQTNVIPGSAPIFPGIFGANCAANPQCPEVPLLARQMLALINHDRLAPAYLTETKGLAQPLRWDPRLAEIARAHSEAMIQQHYFGHVDPNGDSPVERLYKAGIRWHSMGENIAINSTVPLAETAFMNEPASQPNHRGNILNPAFNSVGVGAIRAPDARIYITQDFAEEE